MSTGRTQMVGDKHRLRFAKTDALRLLSHHDLMRCCERMLRRAKLPFKMTGGFHPTPRWVFALSLPLGVIGRNEVVELELTEPLDSEDVLHRLRTQAPHGLTFHSCEVVPSKATAVPRRAIYTLPLPADQVDAVADAAVHLLAEEKVWLDKSHPKPRQVNVRPYIRGIAVDSNRVNAASQLPNPVPATGPADQHSSTVVLDLWVTQQGTVRADDLLRRLGLADLLNSGVILERTDLELTDETPSGTTDAPPYGPPETLPMTHAPATVAGDDSHPTPTVGTWGLSPSGPVLE